MQSDWRNIASGSKIPSEGYCDQPYVVRTDDDAWLCLLTTGKGNEGEAGQHIVATRSTDMGRTWSQPVDIEPPGPPESSWVMPLKVPTGRIYAFYVHNTDNLREVIADTDYSRHRVDTLGHYVLKYSDDHGRTWSTQRFEIPIRLMRIDRENPYAGKVRFFWGVGKPMIHEGSAYIGMSKVGHFGEKFIDLSEGIFLRSDNILTEEDPAGIRWETLPEGDEGLKSPQGPIAEEHNLVALSNGSLYCTYRTIEGYNCHAYSLDGGKTWDGPQYATYANGRVIKQPRAANFLRKFSNGKYLLWFHNHGGRDYTERNPAWLCGGTEKNGRVLWSQPEIVLYDDNPAIGSSYPDFIEDAGRYFITETQKTVARVHEIDSQFLEGLWTQHETRVVAKGGLVLDLAGRQCAQGTSAPLPSLGDLRDGGGFSIDLWIRFARIGAGQTILDTRLAGDKGIVLTTTAEAIRLTLSDGQIESAWECDAGILEAGKWHHVAVIVDGGPKIITFVADGVLCDGGEQREFGWGRFDKDLGDINGPGQIRIAPNLSGELNRLRIYNRYLRTSEAVGNFQAGM